MNDNIKFAVVSDKLNKIISNLNIKISKNPENLDLKNKLKTVLDDKKTLYNGTAEELKELIKKYGDIINE